MNEHKINEGNATTGSRESEKIKVGLIDDHVLLRRGLAGLLTDNGFKVTVEGSNGRQFIENMKEAEMPDVVLTDINMPVMDGFETAGWLKENYPAVKILALSMLDDEQSILKMVYRGAGGYILKDSQPEELVRAIKSIHEKGYYHTDLLDTTIASSMQPAAASAELSKKELQFLKYSCTDMTYKEIATLMKLSPRTIDGYRDELFVKLNVKSRIGLVLYAIKSKIVKTG
jgi:two-component system, NarL family, invasion response regulator UvrY